MKFLKLKFEGARLIKERNKKKNSLGSNRFFHPINELHVYNSFSVLLGRTPKPQLRATDDKYMPMYQDVLDVVRNGFIKINLVFNNELITTVKKSHNSNAMDASQYTWKDCGYVTGTLLPILIYHISNILGKCEDDIKSSLFEDVIKDIQNMGILNESGEYTYDNESINDLIAWCKVNSSTPISNFIENKQINKRPTGFGKRVHRGIVNSNNYNGFIYIPLTDNLYQELIKHTSGFSTILDGGMVTIVGYGEIGEDDIIDFIRIDTLNPIKKFNNEIVKSIIWSDTIYKNIDFNNLETSINKIIKDVGVSITDNQDEYDSVMKKIMGLKFTTDKDGNKEYKLSEIGNKLNNFLENSIDKQYKVVN